MDLRATQQDGTQYSKKFATLPSHTKSDFKEVITAMTGNKGIGMTDNQWSAIVQKNVQKEKDEAEKKKLTLL